MPTHINTNDITNYMYGTPGRRLRQSTTSLTFWKEVVDVVARLQRLLHVDEQLDAVDQTLHLLHLRRA